MKLFKISQNVNNGYDTYSDAVVVAPDEETAITIHPDSMSSYFKGWNAKDWVPRYDQIEVEYIGEAAEHLSQGAVICASFHEG